MRRKSVQCEWNNCALEFGSAIEYWRHCAAHIQAQLAATGFQINLPPETWTEVLPSCGRKSLAKRVGLTQRLFHAISRPLLDGPKGRILPKMGFLRREGKTTLVKLVKNDFNGSQNVELPIAQVAPPENVAGFKLIIFLIFGWSSMGIAVRFVICRLIGSGRNLTDKTNSHNLTALECLLRVIPHFEFGIISLRISSGIELISVELFDRLLTNVRHLRIDDRRRHDSDSSVEVCPGKCSNYVPILVKWLHSPVEDGHQKLASLDIDDIEDATELVSQAKQHFLSANSAPVSYIAAFYSFEFKYADYHDEWPLRNEHNEVLTLRHYSRGLGLNEHYNFVLFRRTSTTAEESEETELLTVKETFESALFFEESPRNKLYFDVFEMGAIDECAFHVDSKNKP